MSSRFASNKNALAMCDVCGFQYKLRVLKELIERGRNTNIKACPTCWNPDDLKANGSVGTVVVAVS